MPKTARSLWKPSEWQTQTFRAFRVFRGSNVFTLFAVYYVFSSSPFYPFSPFPRLNSHKGDSARVFGVLSPSPLEITSCLQVPEAIRCYTLWSMVFHALYAITKAAAWPLSLRQAQQGAGLGGGLILYAISVQVEVPRACGHVFEAGHCQGICQRLFCKARLVR